jgi:hypothetical protein
MPKLWSMMLLLATLLTDSVWAQGTLVPDADDEAPVPRAFFTRSLITGRIECDRSWRCSATDGLDSNNFWYIDMRAIPHEQVAHISENCGYDTSRGCPAQYLIYPEFPFLKVIHVTLATVPKPGE